MINSNDITIFADNELVCNITRREDQGNSNPYVYTTERLDHLSNNDIVFIDTRGNIRIAYRVNSYHNSLLVTEMCNSYCLMCSQPPKVYDDRDFLFDINKRIISQMPKDRLI